jgi:hypothetical protein
MTTPYARHRAEPPSFDDLEMTEPDLRLADVSYLPDDNDEDEAVAFTEAKTEPARPIDDLANTLRDEPHRGPGGGRDEALLAFLETVRRVFGANG